jgi:hypothetical protein
VKKIVETIQPNHVFETKDKTTILADKKTDNNYAVYVVKRQDPIEAAHKAMKAYITKEGPDKPIYILDSSDKKLDRAFLVLGKTYKLDVRNAKGDKIPDDAQLAKEIQNFQQNYTHLENLNPEKVKAAPVAVDPTIAAWQKKIDEAKLTLDQLKEMDLSNLTNTQQALLQDRLVAKQLSKQVDVTKELTAIEDKLRNVDTLIKSKQNENKPSSPASKKGWFSSLWHSKSSDEKTTTPKSTHRRPSNTI